MSDDNLFASDFVATKKKENKTSFTDLLKKKSTEEIEAAICKALSELTGLKELTCDLKSMDFDWSVSGTSSSMSISVHGKGKDLDF